MANPIIIVEYDPYWPALFQSFRSRLALTLGPMADAIEHVGSTSVPGLAAKPILDIDVLLASESELPTAIDQLAQIGYIHQGNLGIPEREAFRPPPDDPPHNLYVCPPSSREFQRHVVFRDYLRTHPSDAKAYGDLKKQLALQFRDERSAYVDGKSEFVTEIIRRANSNHDD